MGLPVAFVLCFFSLIKSSIFISGFIFCLHFHSLMKIWYGNIRPFWEKEELFKGICDGGFGNPSGHSITSVYLYLMLFVYLKETKCIKEKCFIQSIIFVLCIIWIILIILSRIILGIHSVNQVIYGSTLALIVFSFIIFVFKLHKMPVSYYKKLFKEKIYISIILTLIIFLSIFPIISIFVFNKDFNDGEYNKILEKKCPNLPEYRKFNFDGLFGSLVIFCLMGMYLGQILFWYLIDNKYKKNKNNDEENDNFDKNNTSLNEDIDVETEEKEDEEKNNDDINENNDINNNRMIDELINDWNKNRSLLFRKFGTIFKIILVLILCCLPLLLLGLLPKNAHLVLIFIFKFGVPFFATLFFLYGLGFYFIIKLSCGEKEILLSQMIEKKK